MTDNGRISVQGTGSVSVRPDLARLRLRCLGEDDRAASAFDACSSATAAVIAALREAGADDGDLSTSGIALSQRHDDSRYIGMNTLVVTVRPPERAGQVLAVAVEAGGDALAIDNIQFDVADDTEERSQARAQAVLDARRIAQELAAAAGVRLGRLISLEESGGWIAARPVGRMLSGAKAPVLVEVGDQEVAVSVSAVFEIASDTSA